LYLCLGSRPVGGLLDLIQEKLDIAMRNAPSYETVSTTVRRRRVNPKAA
jgi:hypothetical protein